MQNVFYSQSRIKSFKDCQLKYKYGYIDKIDSDVEAIETFRGKIVHSVLEEFYKLVKAGTVKPLDWVTDKYNELWEKNYNANIKIVKKDVEAIGYYNKGKEALSSYYERYRPFDQTKIVDTERLVKFIIRSNSEEYQFQGVLDRLDWNDKTNMFEIHDYKVTGSLMTQEEADSDWQLGLYHIAILEKWPDIKEVKLVWHSLLFNAEFISSRTLVQLEDLQKNVIEEIKKIEECTDFYPHKSSLCDWCSYQLICPLWKHPKAMEVLPINEYKNDSGVQLVTKYAVLDNDKKGLQEKIVGIEAEQHKIEEVAFEYAEKNGIYVIDGPEVQLKIDIKKESRPPMKNEDPEAWQALRDILIKEKKYEEVSTINSNMFKYRVRAWPRELVKKIQGYIRNEVAKSIRLVKK